MHITTDENHTPLEMTNKGPFMSAVLLFTPTV